MYLDIRQRTVPAYLVIAIGLLSLPVIYQNLDKMMWEPAYLMAGVVFAVMYLIGAMSSGDTVLIPLVLSVNNVPVFIALFADIGLFYCAHLRQTKNIPYYIPITGAYIGGMLIG